MPAFDLLEYIRVNLPQKTEFLPQMRDWILPHWYERQNNSLKPTFTAGEKRFVNLTCRSWITLRPAKSVKTVQVDRYGVIYLPERRISIELWVQFEEKLYIPVNFPSIRQKICEDEFGVETSYQLTGLKITTQLKPWLEPDRVSFFLRLDNRPEDLLKRITVYFIVRPFDNNGVACVKHLEYKECCIKVNGRVVLEFEKEPSCCYFSNEENGDVSRFFQLGEGNSKVYSLKGLATGLIGYSGLAAELTGIRMAVCGKNQWRPGSNLAALLRTEIFPKWKDEGASPPRIETGTKIDRLLTANLNYLRVFSGPFPQTFDHLRVLNRYFNDSKSYDYLKKCLKRVRWDGDLSAKLLSPEELILAMTDYFRISGDIQFIEKYWPVLRRVGDGLWYQKGMEFLANKQKGRFLKNQFNFYEKYFWLCAALKSLAELAQFLGRINESQVYKEQYLKLWSGLSSSLSHTVKFYGSKIIPLNPLGGRGGEVVRNLAASYPLELWERENPFIVTTINHLLNRHLYRGGVFSPLEFQGIDLALSARLGQVLIREGYDYTRILDFLLAVAGDTWSWPDRINPLTLEGVGENGHDPEVSFQVLLLIRNIFVLEEEDYLNLFPGVFNNNFWRQAGIEITNLPTYFGEISVKCHSIGNLIQLDFLPAYHRKPEKIRIVLSESLRPVHIDAKFEMKGLVLEIEPGFRKLRLKRMNA